MRLDSCLIVGAGLCGLTAAQYLQERGVIVTVLEKGRGVGGRMATRRVEVGGETAVFDHGAQFFTARSAEFQQALAPLQSTLQVVEWFRGQTKVLEGGVVQHEPDSYSRFRGAPGMTVLAKNLSHGLDVRLKQRVAQIKHGNNQWQVHTEDNETFVADALILTAPVPQSLALLDAGDFRLPPSMRHDLETVQYDPCIAAMLIVEGATKMPAPGALYFSGEPISWIADNFQKGISPLANSLTIHAAPKFSAQHWNDADEEIIKVLCDAAQPFVGSNPSIRASSLQRWRYSKPIQPRQDGCVVAEPMLVFAGDAFAGAKVEGAYLSGLSAAKVLCNE
jgi:renalase